MTEQLPEVAAIAEDAVNPDDLVGEHLPEEDIYDEGEVER